MIDYKNELNNGQYEAVTAEDRRLLFLAGAGTGKTRTLIYRVAYLIENGIYPENILLLTFTNKAADEMVDRLAKMGIGGEITACTFHSFCCAQLRRYYGALGIKKDFDIISVSDSVEVVKMSIVELGYHDIKGFPSAKLLAGIDSMAFNKGMTAEDLIKKSEGFEACIQYTEEINKVLAKAKEYRIREGKLTYDDLMDQYCILLRERPDIAERTRRKYAYIMVDEYQDTNVVQDDILNLIDPYNLAVVGDDCQSLYAFRGAEVHNIIDFPKKTGCKVIKLEENYRSNQSILDISNVMMQEHAKEGIPKWLHANHDKGTDPRLIRPRDQNIEAKLVIDQMKHWFDAGKPLSEFCVLMRTARSSAILESMLVTLGVPYEKRGGPKFFESKHTQDVLAMLNLQNDSRNEIAWFRTLSILRNVAAVNARKMAKDCMDQGPAMLISPKVAKRVFGKDAKRVYELLFTQRIDNLDWHDLFASICEFYVEISKQNITLSKRSEESKQDSMDELINQIKPDLEMLVNIANEYEDMRNFLDSLALENTPQTEENEDKFVLSTIHSAKGLEFDKVILIGASQGVFPRNNDDEELRCYYVALTRSRYELVIYSPEWFMVNGSRMFTDIPVFLQESFE